MKDFWKNLKPIPKAALIISGSAVIITALITGTVGDLVAFLKSVFPFLVQL